MSSQVVIEINDASVNGWRDGALSLASPGYALLGDSTRSIGEEAYAQARVQPRAINDRFWDELSLEPLPTPAGGALRTPADLACDHLAHVWSTLHAGPEAQVMLAVPGYYTRDQLGVLLGMARECAMPVVGMMDAALAAVSRAEPGAPLLHLELHLHRAVVTRFSASEQLARAGVESSRGAGLAQLRERWLNAVARQFIDSTRFDPLHDAQSEQRLYQGIDERLDEFAVSRRVSFEVATASATHTAAVEASVLEQAAEESYVRIVELVRSATAPGESARLHLSHRAARLPGLARRLAELPGLELQSLGPDAVVEGMIASAGAMQGQGGDGVAYVTRIPWAGEGGVARAAPLAAAPSGQVPTHLLYEGIAYGLRRGPLHVGAATLDDGERGITLGAPLSGVSRRHCRLALRDDGQVCLEDTSSHGTFLNGRRVEGEVLLRMGDRLRIGTPGHDMQLIRVAE